jgi:small nuclear ribonucleoprotein (snRNP)-like protein
MTETDLQMLKQNIDKNVRIVCRNGEIVVAKVHLVNEEDEDVIYDLVSTSNESQYEKHDEQPAYLIRFGEIERVEPIAELM